MHNPGGLYRSGSREAEAYRRTGRSQPGSPQQVIGGAGLDSLGAGGTDPPIHLVQCLKRPLAPGGLPPQTCLCSKLQRDYSSTACNTYARVASAFSARTDFSLKGEVPCNCADVMAPGLSTNGSWFCVLLMEQPLAAQEGQDCSFLEANEM